MPEIRAYGKPMKVRKALDGTLRHDGHPVPSSKVTMGSETSEMRPSGKCPGGSGGDCETDA